MHTAPQSANNNKTEFFSFQMKKKKKKSIHNNNNTKWKFNSNAQTHLLYNNILIDLKC